MMQIPKRVVDRLLTKIEVDQQSGCHISTYSVGSHGYAQIGWHEDGHRFVMLAHRVLWTAMMGPIPEGYTIDHVCKTRKCINLDHMRLLSNFENARRTHGRDWPLGQCAQGHPNSALKSYPNGKRGEVLACSICMKEHWTRKNRRRKFKNSRFKKESSQ
jgi:hypothetical protein